VKLLIAAALLATGSAGGLLALLADPLPPAPAQPIPFSHRVHAGEVGLGCTACHAYAERGPVAGLPSLARCQGCHRFIKDDPERPAIGAELRQLTAQLATGQPIAWARVHQVPDHVYFHHQRHLRAGLACRDCHGDVAAMDVVTQVAPLSMGWCVECHRRKQVEAPAERAHLTECITCHK